MRLPLGCGDRELGVVGDQGLAQTRDQIAGKEYGRPRRA
jgi:hypothetical protein